jgi:hypothetical protein
VRVTAALLARYAENETGTGFINVIGGGVDVFGVRWLPVEFSQPFAIQMRFAEAEADQEFQVGMAILGPDLQEIGLPTEFPIVPKLDEFHAEGWEGVIFIAGTVGLYAKQVGGHSVSIRINGSESGSIPFQVVEAPEDNDDVVE